MTSDWGYVWSVMPLLLEATLVTLQATVLGMAVALVLGLLLAILRRSRFRVVRHTATGVVLFVRNTPLLVQLFFLFYVLPQFGFRFDALVVGVVGLGIHFAAYTSEVYRAGIDAVPRGQWEATVALNMTSAHTMRSIILPQAIPPMIPALGNYLISMLKDTAVLSTITIIELFGQARLLASDTFLVMPLYTAVGAMYFAMSYGGSLLIGRLQARIERQRAIRLQSL